MRLLLELILASGFVGTTGFLFRERFQRNYLLSGVVCVLLLGSTFLTIEELAKRIGRAFNPVEATLLTDPPPDSVPKADAVFWLSIKDSAAPGLFEEFLRKFPASVHAAEARKRLQQLTMSNPVVAAPAPDARFCVTVNSKRICE